jgi:hypothetical protein
MEKSEEGFLEETGLKRKKCNSNVPSKWLSEYHWLIVDGDVMKCAVCIDGGAENEWRNGVLYSDVFKKTRLDEHNTAVRHLQAIKRKKEISQALKMFAPKPNKDLDPSFSKKYRNVFRNIYFLARNDLALNLIETLHAHTTLLGVSLPVNHLSRSAGCEILDVIGEYFREMVIAELKECKYFSIMLDETTDNTTTKQLIIYVRYCSNGSALTKFLAIIPLKNFTSVGIYTALMSFLRPYNIFRKICFVCTDGAPVMRSTNEGLAGLVIKENPYVKSFHCIAHRFSLGLNASVNSSKNLTKVLSFVSTCYSYLYSSPKRVLSLFENQKSIDEYSQLLNLQKPIKIRWLSFLRAAGRVCEVYKSIYITFKDLSSEDAQAKGLKHIMEKMHTLLWIHVLSDILPSLNFVLANLEKEQVDAALVHHCIEIAVKNMRETFMQDAIHSARYKKIHDQIVDSFERRVLIYDVIHVKLPKKNQSMEQNFQLFDADLRQFVEHLISKLVDLGENMEFANNFRIFEPSNIRKALSENNLTYGEKEILELSRFYTTKPYTSLPVTLIDVNVTEEWKLYKACAAKLSSDLKREDLWNILSQDLQNSMPNLQDLIELYRILPLSTVECERGFSRMSLIKSDLRSRLSDFRLDTLMHISLNGTDNIERIIDELIVIWEQKKKRVV